MVFYVKYLNEIGLGKWSPFSKKLDSIIELASVKLRKEKVEAVGSERKDLESYIGIVSSIWKERSSVSQK